MEMAQTTRAFGGGLVASAQEQAAVAELMTPSERLVADPPLYSPMGVEGGALLLALSPNEPVDDPDDE